MKAILEFNLPDDRMEYEQYKAAPEMASFIWEYSQYLREQVKYSEDPDDIEKAKEKFNEMLNDENIDLNKIMQ